MGQQRPGFPLAELPLHDQFTDQTVGIGFNLKRYIFGEVYDEACEQIAELCDDPKFLNYSPTHGNRLGAVSIIDTTTLKNRSEAVADASWATIGGIAISTALTTISQDVPSLHEGIEIRFDLSTVRSMRKKIANVPGNLIVVSPTKDSIKRIRDERLGALWSIGVRDQAHGIPNPDIAFCHIPRDVSPQIVTRAMRIARSRPISAQLSQAYLFVKGMGNSGKAA